MYQKKKYRKKTLMERFLRSFSKEEGSSCWNWLLHLDRDGYGHMTIRYENGDILNKKSHRMAYSLLVGEVPDGMSVCHKCDNPKCVNPDHLFLGTQQDNMNDKQNKNRHHFGEKHPMAKLKEEDVSSIKFKANSGSTHDSIAKEYGVCRQTISRIVSGSGWANLDESDVRH